MESTTILLVSDEMAPFAQFNMSFAMLNSNILHDYACKDKFLEVSLTSAGIYLHDLSPPATGIVSGIYERAITPSLLETDAKRTPMLELSLRVYSQTFRNPSLLTVNIRHAKIVFLQKFLMGELMQYYFEKIASWLFHDEVIDENGNPSPPLRYRVELEGGTSTVIVPKESLSVGSMCGIKFDRIIFENDYVSESWSIPDRERSSHHFHSFNQEAKAMDNALSEDEFFDAVEVEIAVESKSPNSNAIPNDSPLSTYSTKDIPQIRLQLFHVRIFSTTEVDTVNVFHDDKSARKNESLIFGIAPLNEGEPAYYARIQGDCRKIAMWEEITNSDAVPLSLNIVIDTLPRKRILITTIEENDIIKLQLRTRQLHLLLSIWFCNMQELPIMFPYSKEYLKQNIATPVESAIPEYDSTDWVKYTREGEKQLLY